MEDTLVLRINTSDYFFKDEAEQINLFATYKNQWEYRVYHLLKKLAITANPMSVEWRKQVRTIEKVILFDSGWDYEITSYIKKVNPKCRIHLFLFNVVSNESHKAMLEDSNINKIWSFDKNDVNKYHLLFNTPFYAKNKFCPWKSDALYDVVFVGASKHRKKEIEMVSEVCKDSGLKTDFHIISRKEDYIDYQDYIQLINNSRAILDIVNPGQRGLTLRVMEAMFLSKKLITNNADVINYDFYHPNNIYVLGRDTNSLKQFMELPFHGYTAETINYYSVDEWIKRFR